MSQELGHGSNVMGIETRADYDRAAGEFVVHTPNNAASKFWIGGMAQTAKISTVFAQARPLGRGDPFYHARAAHGSPLHPCCLLTCATLVKLHLPCLAS
jgi:hypothetical protein